ncbi:MAG: MarR family transcriptional regulator [Acidimicrobiia bacterium]
MSQPPQAETVRTLARLARVLERSCGELTLPQYRLLAMISEGSERATALAGRLALAKPSVSAMVDALVERNLVTRARVDGDRRAVRLQLTTAGEAALRGAEVAMVENLQPLLDRCDATSVDAAVAQLAGALDAAFADRIAARR